MRLLERQDALDRLQRWLTQAGTGPGRVVWLGGEAGIGKTSLLRTFAATPQCAATRPLWGACDPLFTPRPLGPLHDIAAELGSGVPAALTHDAGRLEVFVAVLDALGRQPRCLVFEDLHWADEATLDLLAYLGRRIERTRTLVLASYRDDEIGRAHPLRRVLGALPGAARLALAPLSAQAVRELAGARALDADAVHRASGGNPFYATELLALGDPSGVPPTVQDAVLARAARLSAAAQAVLEAAAVVGPRIEPALVAALVDGSDAARTDAALDACLAAGVLREAPPAGLEFRHELARQAVLGALSAPRRQALHGRALQCLRALPGIDLARLAHHAEAAQDGPAVLAFAAPAARQAAAVGAHREAHAQFARAARFADLWPDAERADLLEELAVACGSVGRYHEGIAARERALALRRTLGDAAGQALNLCALAGLLVQVGRNADAEAAAHHALDLLEPLAPGRALAAACRVQSFLRMVARDNEEAIRWGRRAVELGERFGDPTVVAAAYNSIGSATIHLDYEAGCALLERSREIARAAGNDAMFLNADSNLGSASGEVHRFERAQAYLAQGIAYAIEHERDPAYLQSWLALCWVHLGRWSEGGELAHAVLLHSRESAISHNMAHLALGRLRARRGDAGAWSALDEALRLALESGHLQRIAPVRAARAEAAWLEGDAARCREEARAAYDFAARYRHPWFVGELAWWRRTAGDDTLAANPAEAARPYACQLAGDWRGAAAAWRELACPYEEARALALGERDAQRDALVRFERLGARPAAEALRQQLAEAGERGLPPKARGPRAATRDNAFGLTAREQQVLVLLCGGLRNADIAARLHRSVRTVDHHLAAVFAKLGVDSRLAAIQVAQRAGLLAAQSGQAPTAK